MQDQTNNNANNTFFRSHNSLNSPTAGRIQKDLANSLYPNTALSPRNTSNHSRNSMVDLEFNNSIPSERQDDLE